VISTLIMGSPAVVSPTRLHADGTDPITAMQGQTTDEGTDQTLDTNRLTLMSGCALRSHPRRPRIAVTIGTPAPVPRADLLTKIKGERRETPQRWTRANRTPRPG
jgi:hypothetical protein